MKILSIPASLAAVALLAATGCGGPTEPQAPVASYEAFVLDVSGSVDRSGALDGYGARTAQLIQEAPEGTTISVIDADGSALASVCIPRSVRLLGEGPNRTQRQDDLAADREEAVALVDEQLRCGREKGTPGTDLLGGLMLADRAAPADGGPVVVRVFSDGMQASKDITLSRRMLRDEGAITAAVEKAEAAGLVPSRLAGGSLSISDPGAGAPLSAAQAIGVDRFWSAYATAASMTLTH